MNLLLSDKNTFKIKMVMIFKILMSMNLSKMNSHKIELSISGVSSGLISCKEVDYKNTKGF